MSAPFTVTEVTEETVLHWECELYITFEGEHYAVQVFWHFTEGYSAEPVGDVPPALAEALADPWVIEQALTDFDLKGVEL